MIGYKHSATGARLILVLICALVPTPAHAGDGGQVKPLRLYATSTFGPIGRVALNSLSGNSVEINGRVARDGQVIWNGDLIGADGESGARVLLDSFGQVALRSGAQVRIATKIAMFDDAASRPVLIAELVSGDLAVTLQPAASAYIEAGGSVFYTTPGARFRIGVSNGRPVIEMTRGDVSIEQLRRTRIKPRDVQVRPDGSIVEVTAAPLDTKPNKRTQDRIRWMKSLEAGGGGRTLAFVAFRGPSTGPQLADETPVRDRLVTFLVDPPLGSIPPARTDARGIVTYTFNAGRNPGNGRIIATIEKASDEDPVDTIYEPYSRDFTIAKLGFWRLRTKILVAIAAVGVSCVVGCHKGDGPIKQQPPPMIP